MLRRSLVLLTALIALACATGSDPGMRRTDGSVTRDAGADAGLPDAAAPDAESDAGPPDRDGDGVPDDIDCAPDDPAIGRFLEEPCASSCAAGVRTCTDGVFTECTAREEDCDCSADAMRAIDCPRCGTQRQRCVAGRWSDDGMCMPGGPCTGGDRETRPNTACEGGEEVRVCGAGCQFGDWSCPMGPATGLWVLPTGAERWMRFPLDPAGSPFAPTEPVEAAFELGDEAFIVTRTRYHVLRPSDRQWIRAGLRSALFPELGAREVRAAYTTLARLHGGTLPDVTFTTASHAIIYAGFDGTSANDVIEVACCTMQWTTPQAPRADQIRAMWIDPDNVDGWPVSMHPTCEAPTGFYSVVLAGASRAHLQSPACDSFQFVASLPYASFPPFALPDAPPFDQIGDVFYLSGLFAVRR